MVETQPRPVPAPKGPAPAAGWRRWARPVVVVVALAVAFIYGAWPVLNPPETREAGAPATGFSAGRAMAHVDVVARQPHPAGSPAMAAVAEYLATELGALGVEVERQDIGSLHNVAGRIRGTDPTGAVLFVSHPDSLSETVPGAGDNATGVAVLLETVRALAAGPPLRNDVIVLFDDGEEQGFRGGEAFAARHPWMADVALAVGVDTAAWGTPHVSQIADAHGAVAGAYAAGANNPVAHGFTSAVLQDATFETAPFRSRGVPSIEIEDTYANANQHTAGDTVDGVAPGSVQYAGDQVLGLARRAGTIDLRALESSERVYHTLPGLGVVHYPAWWDAVLMAVAALGLTAVVVVGVRQRRLDGRRLAVGVGFALGLTAVSTLLAVVAAALYEARYPNPNPYLEEYLLPSSAPFALVSCALIATVFGFGWWLACRRVGAAELAIAFLGVWTVVGVVLLLVLPGTEYVLVWPALAACGAWMLLVVRRPKRPAWALLAPGLVVVAICAPLTLIGFFGAGVADLPLQVLLGTLAAGLVAPAFTSAAPDREAGQAQELLANVGDPSLRLGPRRAAAT